jgi:threonine dehydratase
LNDRDTGAEAAVHFSKLEAREPHAHRCLQPARRHVYFDRLKRARPQVQGIVTATRGNHGQSLAFAGTHAGSGSNPSNQISLFLQRKETA